MLRIFVALFTSICFSLNGVSSVHAQHSPREQVNQIERTVRALENTPKNWAVVLSTVCEYVNQGGSSMKGAIMIAFMWKENPPTSETKQIARYTIRNTCSINSVKRIHTDLNELEQEIRNEQPIEDPRDMI